MLTLAALAIVLAPQTAGEVVSNLLTRYNAAVSVVGNIKFVQSYKGVSVTTDTALQYEKPSKLYAKQVRPGEDPWLVTSDGQLFSYSAPLLGGFQKGKRLIERVDQLGKLLTVREIYGASLARILDRSAPMEIAIGRLEDLRLIRNQWASMQLGEPDPKGNKVVTGKWREDGGSTPSGTYEMLVSPEGDLLRYTIKEMRGFRGPDGKQIPPDLLVSDWQVTLKIDAPVDPALFSVVR
jgi:hypothetical protein